MGIVRHKYSNKTNFRGLPLFLNFFKKCSRSGHSISNCPDKRYPKPLLKLNFRKEKFYQAIMAKKNPPNKQVTSNNLTAKSQPFTYHTRSNGRDHRNTSRHRSSDRASNHNSKPYFGKNNSKPPSRFCSS